MSEALQTGESPYGPVMKCYDLTESCDLCGQDAVIEIDEKGWCASCLHAQGSCCGESEKDGCPD